jgi:hypothetical protein
MICRFARIAGFLLSLFLIIFLTPIPAEAVGLDSEFSIPLKEKDRILGSLEGNFLIYGRPTITMYNPRGKTLFSRKLKNNVKPTLSPNGKHLGLITYADHSPTDLKTLKLERYDHAGKYMWNISKPAANEFMIANNGAIFGIEGVKGISPTRIHLYDPYGDLLNVLTFKEYHGIAISESGGKFIIDRARDGLEVYDSLGNFLDSLPVSKNYVIDKDERYIGTFFQGVFRLFQDEKEVVSIRAQEMVVKEIVINVEQNLAILMALKRIEVYELTTQKLLWEYRIVEGKKRLVALDVTEDARFIACGMDINGGNQVPKDKRHVEGYMLLFPGDGKSMVRHKETYDIWAAGLPKAVFPGTSSSVILQTREKIEKFRIKPGRR